MALEPGAPDFGASLGCLISPGTAELAAQLSSVAGLAPEERDVILAASEDALRIGLHRKLCRLLILELNSARVGGRLEGADTQARWCHFIELSSKSEFWDGLSAHYPTLLGRVDRLIRNHCAASLTFARRWASDRPVLDPLFGGPSGALTSVTFGAGDSHGGGYSVAILSCENGRAVYKPRSVATDEALGRFVASLAKDAGHPLPMAVPAVVGFEAHGWAEFVPHRYAAGQEERHSFYEGIGHWLAVMRLLGGTDLHVENLIAHGGSPVVVDCETLFTPKVAPFPSGYGEATDKAAALVAETVLATGLLPVRAQGLGWRGADMSGIGSLPGEQPVMMLPGIIGAGTDEARIGPVPVEPRQAQNHPAPQPALADYWPDVLKGFDDLSERLRELDRRGVLRRRLELFEDCRVRVVVRATEVYSELARMLWHPVSLHKPEQARADAHDLLAKMAANVSGAPSDPAVIDAEIDELLIGDVPAFSTIARCGVLDGPAGVTWLTPCNLVEDAWQNWREADLSVERNYVRSALVSAYVNDGWAPDQQSFWPVKPRLGDIEVRRRGQAAAIMRKVIDAAIHGRDGTVNWIAPALSPSGSSVRPLEVDLYGGLSGIALLTGAYLRERDAGRADPVDGADRLFAALLRTLDAAEEKHLEQRGKGAMVRPPAPGAYLGLGSRIWGNLVLAEWGLDGGNGFERAVTLARDIPRAAASDDVHDLLTGKAGAIPPLLALARRSGDEQWLRMAHEIGAALCEDATRRDDAAFWTHTNWPEGVGGFAHGVTGVGWALFQLARATGEERFDATARSAFAFEEALYDAGERNWIDLRMFESAKSCAAWCHGAVGIGLARLDLDPVLADPATRRSLRRAVSATMRLGLGWNHCACHGDVGAWELLDRAIALGEGPEGLSRDGLLASILTSLEDRGPICGLLRDAFIPGLMSGLGGVAYQLLRAHPDSALPSILTLGGSEF